jgi:hypothetical protein
MKMPLVMRRCIAGFLVLVGFAFSEFHSAYAQIPPLQGYVVSAPAGTAMQASMSMTLSSEYARVGDRFTAVLGSDVMGSGGILLPAGTQLQGQVVSLNKAGMAGRNGALEVRFVSATLPTGQQVPISARIQTEDNTGIIRGGTALRTVGYCCRGGSGFWSWTRCYCRNHYWRRCGLSARRYFSW